MAKMNHERLTKRDRVRSYNEAHPFDDYDDDGRPKVGPMFLAKYGGTCSECLGPFVTGEVIRYVGGDLTHAKPADCIPANRR